MGGAPSYCKVGSFGVRPAPARKVWARKSPLFRSEKKSCKPDVLTGGNRRVRLARCQEMRKIHSE